MKRPLAGGVGGGDQTQVAGKLLLMRKAADLVYL